MDLDKGKFQYSALQWLYEMELVDDPQLINNLKLNVFSISKYVRECELLSSQQHRQMLVYVELSWIGRKFLEKRIVEGVTDRVKTLLPNFKIRVVTDRKIFDLALDRVRRVLTGGTVHEKVPSTSAVDSDPSSGN